MRRWLLWIFVCLFRPVLNALLSPTRSQYCRRQKASAPCCRHTPCTTALGARQFLRRYAPAACIGRRPLRRARSGDVQVPESDLAEADRRIAEAARTTGLKALLAPPEVFGSQPQQHFRCLTKRCKRALPLQTSALSSATLPQARPKPSPSCAVILKLKLQTNGCLLKSALSPRSLPASQGFRDPPIAFPLPARLGAKPFWKAQGSFSPVEFGLL